MDPKIVVKGNRLLVKDFETEEEEIVSYFKGAKADEIEKRFNSSLRVGVLALKTIGTTEKVDYIEKEFNKLDSKFTKVLDKTKDEISSNIDDTFGERGEVERLVEKYLGENGAFSELLEKQFGEDGVVVKDLFNPTKEGSPICELKKIIVEKLDNLGKSLGIKEAEEKIIEKTALKGVGFEDLCEQLLGEIVRPNMGDELRRTGNEIGKVTNSKKGDFVIDVRGKSEYRIVFETKDRGSIALSEIQDELNEALKNRSAKFGIFAVKWVEALPNSVGCFNCYGDDKIVCALGSKNDEVLHKELLQTAYFWARTNLLKKSRKITDVDFHFIDTKLDEIRSQLDSFNDIKRQCSNIDKASQKIEESCEEMKEKMNNLLQSICEELEKHTED